MSRRGQFRASLDSLAADHREWFEERAGILEYEAGHARSQAEVLALLMTLHRYPEALVALAVRQVEVDGEIRWALTLDRARCQETGATDGIDRVSGFTLVDVLKTHFNGTALLSAR